MIRLYYRIKYTYIWAVYGDNYSEVFHVPNDRYVQWLFYERKRP